MRSAPTLNSWMMPFSSVAMIEKLALVRIAYCRAPAFSRAFSRRLLAAPLPASPAGVALFPALDILVAASQSERTPPLLRRERMVEVCATAVCTLGHTSPSPAGLFGRGGDGRGCQAQLRQRALGER